MECLCWSDAIQSKSSSALVSWSLFKLVSSSILAPYLSFDDNNCEFIDHKLLFQVTQTAKVRVRELERGREFVFGFEGSPTGTDVPRKFSATYWRWFREVCTTHCHSARGRRLTPPIRTARAAPHPPLCTHSSHFLFLYKTDRHEYFVEVVGLTNFSWRADVKHNAADKVTHHHHDAQRWAMVMGRFKHTAEYSNVYL